MLSNIVLDELDRELTRAAIRTDADDCIYVSPGGVIMTVSWDAPLAGCKSAVARPWERS